MHCALFLRNEYAIKATEKSSTIGVTTVVVNIAKNVRQQYNYDNHFIRCLICTQIGHIGVLGVGLELALN